ncbi:hypothetical protein I4N56_009900 [Pseudomonas mohnii]|uniref:hypothetical protein n=1 Tax=Pseudomonas mohnii TaxID=395600 RepID=UPI0018DDBA83|nr:hypothetical protein [Pseudomonas mohnii]MBH8611224.1 hypothetical protein [Pseudomonas mohnii]
MRQFQRVNDLEVNVSNKALEETVIAQSQIITALIASVRKKDALDLTLFNQMIETMRKDHKEDVEGNNKTYNKVIETAKSACLITTEQPQVRR